MFVRIATIFTIALTLLSCSESEDVTPLIEDLQRDIKAIQFTLEAFNTRLARSDDIIPMIEDLQNEYESLPPLLSGLQKSVEELEGDLDSIIENTESRFNALTSLIESSLEVSIECNLYDDWVGSWRHVPSIFNDIETGVRFHNDGHCDLIVKEGADWIGGVVFGNYWVCSESYILVFFADEGPTMTFGSYSLDGDELTLLWYDGDLAFRLEKD